MQTLQRGQKLRLDSLAPRESFRVEVEARSPGVIFDCSCFGIDAGGRLSDDRYFIFYNQRESPCGSVRMEDSGKFQLGLSTVPEAIQRLVFVLTIDGESSMNALVAGSWSLVDDQGATMAAFPFTGGDFSTERAVIVAELYRKEGWRIAVVGQGFGGGLAALLRHFGGEEAKEEASPPPPSNISPKVSLEKKLQQAAPHLLSLAKPLKVSLEKRNLQEVVARVALVLDTSGSMYGQYRKGDVQTIVDRLFPLAVHFDDDGQLETWAFGEKSLALPAVHSGNLKDYIVQGSGNWEIWRKKLGSATNNEPVVMRAVIDHFRDSALPAYVMFVSDGGVASAREIKSLMTEASALPIFWQFVGIGGKNYGILEKLDDMGGRIVDNCSFFSLDDIHAISEQELYERLLNEFPSWLKEAKVKRIVR